eukprot:1184531-Prorocentrum_minimum.AAC.3
MSTKCAPSDAAGAAFRAPEGAPGCSTSMSASVLLPPAACVLLRLRRRARLLLLGGLHRHRKLRRPWAGGRDVLHLERAAPHAAQRDQVPHAQQPAARGHQERALGQELQPRHACRRCLRLVLRLRRLALAVALRRLLPRAHVGEHERGDLRGCARVPKRHCGGARHRQKGAVGGEGGGRQRLRPVEADARAPPLRPRPGLGHSPRPELELPVRGGGDHCVAPGVVGERGDVPLVRRLHSGNTRGSAPPKATAPAARLTSREIRRAQKTPPPTPCTPPPAGRRDRQTRSSAR